MILIKLGGSVITDKTGEYAFRADNAMMLAEELCEAGKPCIIVHGAGSFGHPKAKRYSLQNGYTDPSQWEAVAAVQRDVRLLNLNILDCLHEQGIRAVSVPLGVVGVCRDKKLETLDVDVFRAYLDLGLTPTTFGDVVLDRALRFCICSGDLALLYLARELKPERVVFATNVDGVYNKDPREYKSAKLIRECDADMLAGLGSENASGIDVTGAMKGKLECIAQIAREGVPVTVLNGLVPGRLKASLLGEEVEATQVAASKVETSEEEEKVVESEE